MNPVPLVLLSFGSSAAPGFQAVRAVGCGVECLPLVAPAPHLTVIPIAPQHATANWSASMYAYWQPMQGTAAFVALTCRCCALSLQRAAAFVTTARAADVLWRCRSVGGRRTGWPATGREAARPKEHGEYGSGYNTVQLQCARLHGFPLPFMLSGAVSKGVSHGWRPVSSVPGAGASNHRQCLQSRLQSRAQ